MQLYKTRATTLYLPIVPLRSSAAKSRFMAIHAESFFEPKYYTTLSTNEWNQKDWSLLESSLQFLQERLQIIRRLYETPGRTIAEVLSKCEPAFNDLVIPIIDSILPKTNCLVNHQEEE